MVFFYWSQHEAPVGVQQYACVTVCTAVDEKTLQCR